MTRTGVQTRSANARPSLRALPLAILTALAVVPAAQAIEIKTEKWRGSFDSTLSVGAGWRMEEQDKNKIGLANGGRAWSNNNDDGNLNFEKGDTFSKAIRGLHELDMTHEDGYGFFIRGFWLYDVELMDEDRKFRQLNSAETRRQGKDQRLLDAYVFGNFDFGGQPVQVRAGNQVMNWGESTLIGHSISEINAVDSSKLRAPGSELKEAYIPVQTLWGSYQITDSLAIEAYAQFEWEPLRFDAPGTFLSTQDFVGDTYVASGPCAGTFGIVHLLFGQVPEANPSTQACRIADKKADDDGQWGVKLSWTSEALGDTNFGFYYSNYHNKRPIISAYAHNGNRVEGMFEFLENIEMMALSFNTSLNSGWSIGGEISYRKDEPLQIDDVELLFATLEPVGIISSGYSQIPGGSRPGDLISGYRLFDTYQAQATFTNVFGPMMGADNFVFLAEVGANWIPDLPSQDVMRFEVAGTSRSGNVRRAGNGLGQAWTGTGCFQVNPADRSLRQCEGTETNEFATDLSWGYRLVARWEFNDAFAGVNVTPRFIFQHDVDGYTPAPISNFMQDRMAATAGVSFEYMNAWRWDVAYASYFGNDDQDPLSDRDFVSASMSYSF